MPDKSKDHSETCYDPEPLSISISLYEAEEMDEDTARNHLRRNMRFLHECFGFEMTPETEKMLDSGDIF